MLRWRLKKSVPFEAEETLISYMRQAPRDDGVDIVTGLARLRIVKEYESLLESAGLQPGVVMSSTLAALPLLDDRGPTMLARISGAMLTTAIAREGILCGYRCTELPSSLDTLAPRTFAGRNFPGGGLLPGCVERRTAGSAACRIWNSHRRVSGGDQCGAAMPGFFSVANCGSGRESACGFPRTGARGIGCVAGMEFEPGSVAL